MSRELSERQLSDRRLSDRQESVLSALVRAYVAGAAPVGSGTLSHTLPVQLSSASIRNTMAELTDLGLIEQPHTSAGRIPTVAGLRTFVDDLMDPPGVAGWERRRISQEMDEAGAETSLQAASALLARCTHQLGFAVLPRLDRVALRQLTLIRVTSERVLVVLVSRSGVTYQRFLTDEHSSDAARLRVIETQLNRRLAGHSLVELRQVLERELERLRDRADQLAAQTLLTAVRALVSEARARGDVLLSSRSPLLGQPEFHDPERLRALMEAVETRETLVAFLDRVLERDGVAVTFGGEVEVPELVDCAMVSAPCDSGGQPLGVVGVLGPSRMDYPRVVPLVALFSELVKEKVAS
jgi:heat-inducible transcriptional repressor